MTEARAPIHSTRENDPEATPAIDAFVIKLAEDVDLLQDAQSDDDLDTLAKLAASLIGRADKAGYPILVKASQALIRACADQKPEDAEAAIVEMTELSLCIRLGHRGSA